MNPLYPRSTSTQVPYREALLDGMALAAQATAILVVRISMLVEARLGHLTTALKPRFPERPLLNFSTSQHNYMLQIYRHPDPGPPVAMTC